MLTLMPDDIRPAHWLVLQELLESPHLTLELASLIDTIPKNLDKVQSHTVLQSNL